MSGVLLAAVHFGISLGDLVDFAANRTATGSEAALKAAMATLLGLHRAVWHPPFLPRLLPSFHPFPHLVNTAVAFLRLQWYFVVGEHDAMSFPYSQLVDLYEVEIRGLLPRHARAVYYTMSPAKGIRLIALDFADAGLFGRDPSDPALVRREPSCLHASHSTAFFFGSVRGVWLGALLGCADGR